jgi:hypothetical protein
MHTRSVASAALVALCLALASSNADAFFHAPFCT